MLPGQRLAQELKGAARSSRATLERRLGPRTTREGNFSTAAAAGAAAAAVAAADAADAAGKLDSIAEGGAGAGAGAGAGENASSRSGGDATSDGGGGDETGNGNENGIGNGNTTTTDNDNVVAVSPKGKKRFSLAAAGNAILAASDMSTSLTGLLLPHASGDWATDAASASSVAMAAAAAAAGGALDTRVEAVAAPLDPQLDTDRVLSEFEARHDDLQRQLRDAAARRAAALRGRLDDRRGFIISIHSFHSA